MNEFLNQILIAVAGAIGLGLASLIGWGFTELNKWLATKTKNEKLFKVTQIAQQLVQDAVKSVQQTFVEQLKKDGKFDADKQKEALELALKKVIANLTPEVEKVLKEAYGDIVEWLTNLIESFIFTELKHSTVKAQKVIKG